MPWRQVQPALSLGPRDGCADFLDITWTLGHVSETLPSIFLVEFFMARIIVFDPRSSGKTQATHEAQATKLDT